ncbi:MAG: hypothetical protein Q9218_005527 [Villophora microphyllina]
MADISQLVLITGTTDFICFRTLIEALKAGYRVRAAVRNEKGIRKVKAAASAQPYLNQLSFVLVPNILKYNAYSEEVRGVDYILHPASPIPNLGPMPSEETYDKVLVQPAGAGKVAALNATQQYVRTQKPHFEVNYVDLAFVIGRHELAVTKAEAMAGTNGTALGHVLGNTGGPTPSTSVPVDGVAKMHVHALDPKVAGEQFFLGVSDRSSTNWEDAFKIVKKYLPEAVEKGVFPLSGSHPTKRLLFDSEYTKRILGNEFASFEEQIKSVAKQYRELGN